MALVEIGVEKGFFTHELLVCAMAHAFQNYLFGQFCVQAGWWTKQIEVERVYMKR